MTSRLESRETSKVFDIENLIRSSEQEGLSHAQMQGAAGWLTFISDLFGGATLASSTLISPSGILLSAWCMILRDCLISSTLHRYLIHKDRKWRWSTDTSNMGESAPKGSWDIKERCEQKLEAAPKLLVHLTGKGQTCRDKKSPKKGSFIEKKIF